MFPNNSGLATYVSNDFAKPPRSGKRLAQLMFIRWSCLSISHLEFTSLRATFSCPLASLHSLALSF
jgi:hypothetical protein